jgi:hypothetical protein
MVADNRTPNLLILREPAVDRPPVTAEVASSSLVVPAISFQSVTRKEWLPRLFPNPNSNPRSILSRFLTIFSELNRFQILALGLHLLAIHGVNVARSGLRFRMAKHRLDY